MSKNDSYVKEKVYGLVYGLDHIRLIPTTWRGPLARLLSVRKTLWSLCYTVTSCVLIWWPQKEYVHMCACMMYICWLRDYAWILCVVCNCCEHVLKWMMLLHAIVVSVVYCLSVYSLKLTWALACQLARVALSRTPKGQRSTCELELFTAVFYSQFDR